MYYKNARILCSDFTFHTGAFEVKDGKVADFLVCSADYTSRRVFLAGQER